MREIDMIIIIDCGSYALKINEILSKNNIPSKIVKIEQVEQNFDLSGVSGIIISGSSHIPIAEDQSCVKHFSFIKTAQIPVLGICLGHQIIGLLYGSRLTRKTRTMGEQLVTVLCGDSLFTNIYSAIFSEDHCNHITLPDDFRLLADSHTSKNEAMEHKNKPLFGVQFHPEISGEKGERLLLNFCKICGAF